MSEVIDRDITKPLVVGGESIGSVAHVPTAVSPVETTAVMSVNPALVAITQDAAVWASRAPKPSVRVRPELAFEVSGTLLPALYTPDGLATSPAWKTRLLSPPVQDTGYAGDAGGFTKGVRGPQSALPADTREARVAAISCMTVPQPGASDFRALLSPTATLVNVWRFGPGAFAIDICIGASAVRFNRTVVCRVRTTTPATLREAYVPAGGFYRPIGAQLRLDRAAKDEVVVELDLRRAEIRPVFLRVIVAWEMPIDQDGTRRQCLLALKAPIALSAAAAGEVLAGGAVVGNKAHPIGVALNHSFCRVGVSGAVAANSPGGLGVIVGSVDGRSALFGEGGGFTLNVSDAQVDADDHTLMLTFVPVGDWRGSFDERSTLLIEMDAGDGWQPLAEHTFSNDTAYQQSYPHKKGVGVVAALSGCEAVNQYQFGEDTPMLTLPSVPVAPSLAPAAELEVPIRTAPSAVPTMTMPGVYVPPATPPAVISSPVKQYAPVTPAVPVKTPPGGFVTCLALGCPKQPVASPDPAWRLHPGGYYTPCIMPNGCRSKK